MDLATVKRPGRPGPLELLNFVWAILLLWILVELTLHNRNARLGRTPGRRY